MFRCSVCAFLGPALVSAAAFPWAGPEPTLVAPEPDGWSPAPTEAPEFGGIELFRRASEDNTCGYVSGDPQQSLTCNNQDYVCATNTYYGVHGCCDPNAISTCSIPTTCIPSSLLAASCTGDCSTNDYVAKCTDSSQPYCYEWRYVYGSRTIMTEHGCASEAFTLSVLRTMSGAASSSLPSEAVVSDDITSATSATSTAYSSSTGTQSSTASPTSTVTTEQSGKKSGSNVAPIVGGVVGGLVVIGAVAFGIIFLIMRNKKQKQTAANAVSGVNQPFIGGAGPAGVTEYKPQAGGFPTPQPYDGAPGYYGQEHKWPQGSPYSPQMSPTPQYPGTAPLQPGAMPAGVAEAGGYEVPQPQRQQQAHVYEAP